MIRRRTNINSKEYLRYFVFKIFLYCSKDSLPKPNYKDASIDCQVNGLVVNGLVACHSDPTEVHIRAGGHFRVEGVQGQVDRSGPLASKDLTVGRFKVSRYLEWRQREGSAIAEGLFPLSFTRERRAGVALSR